MRRWLVWIGGVLVLVVVLTLVGALVWTQLGPEPTAAARRVAGQAEGTGDRWFAFGPASSAVGVILYPGARIDADAYAPAARDLAEATDARVVVVDPPFDVALLAVDAATAVRADHPDVDRWVVGGHSLGGVAATRYAAASPDDVAGVLLWASYPASGDPLPGDLAAASVTGDRDEVLDRTAYDDARALLPADTEFVELAGVNHAQFGAYGAQPGDGEATVSDVEARSRIVQASGALVERVGPSGG